MDAPRNPALRFLWHPGTRDTFSGYGLGLEPAHLVGLVMVDRPDPVDPEWLATIKQAFGDYQLTAMTQTGERGIVCQMLIAPDSTEYLRSVISPQTEAMRQALLPLRENLPAVTLALAWYPGHHCWVSQIVQTNVPLFSVGSLVATPGALKALQRAEQSPGEFIRRHLTGDWGELTDDDRQENNFSVQYGFRILSAYTTSAGDKIWVITEHDRSVTTILLPDDY